MQLQYPIYILKAKLSEAIRKVKKGNEIIVSERGVPVVKITALNPSYEKTPLEKHLQKLRDEGLLLPAIPKKDWPDSFPGDYRPGALKRFLRERQKR